MLKDEFMVFTNSKEEPFILKYSLQAGILGVWFYAAALLSTSDGYKIGAECLIDKKVR